ncbi:hypothetical protein ECE50_006855 [Chitinophaga sp. Mgbs1]|uniref:Uncharacterized protein n=1 Tax=Chitinophaga solisilvae TaxID=1233460 RepID=A0A9Q5GRR9_9BACT|nr:hypothetical protein [Chitinophaga solisilvae]
MKWLLYILSAYILLLSCIPCTDAEGSASYSSAVVADAASHNHETQADFCSPLCVCSCCNVQVTPGIPFFFSYHLSRIPVLYPVLPDSPLPAVADNIWQPPRLV